MATIHVVMWPLMMYNLFRQMTACSNHQKHGQQQPHYQQQQQKHHGLENPLNLPIVIIFELSKLVHNTFIDRVWLKNHLAKILQVKIPSIFSPFLRYPPQPWLTLK